MLSAKFAGTLRALGKDTEEHDGREDRRYLKHTPPALDGDVLPPAKNRRFLSPATASLMKLDDTCMDSLAKEEEVVVSAERKLAPPRESMEGMDEQKLSFDVYATRGANSTSSILVSSTLAQPDTDQIILCMSSVLQVQMIHDKDASDELKARFKIFEQAPEGPEELGIDKLADAADAVPSVDTIYRFINGIFRRAGFSAECNIIALVYINRVIAKFSLPLHKGNWPTVVLAAVILAQKVWDDRSLNTANFALVVPAYSKKQIRTFEGRFLELLEYQATVTQALYARYYFELRSLFEQLVGGTAEFPLQPTPYHRLRRLENISQTFRMVSRSGTQSRRPRRRDDKSGAPKSPGPSAVREVHSTGDGNLGLPRSRYVIS